MKRFGAFIAIFGTLMLFTLGEPTHSHGEITTEEKEFLRLLMETVESEEFQQALEDLEEAQKMLEWLPLIMEIAAEEEKKRQERVSKRLEAISKAEQQLFEAKEALRNTDDGKKLQELEEYERSGLHIFEDRMVETEREIFDLKKRLRKSELGQEVQRVETYIKCIQELNVDVCKQYQ